LGCGTNILAGHWSTGRSEIILIDYILTVDVPKMASRKVVEFGAGLLIFISFNGKLKTILDPTAPATVVSLLCFMQAMLATPGL
jgi:Na+-translocating ferredoxin:NAD+ oxidoreductase RnfD subunit